jgi:signal transduction histidine kinase
MIALRGHAALITGSTKGVGRSIAEAFAQAGAEYAPNGTEIALGLTSAGGQARIVVADQGRGIPRELRQKALERFFRAESSRSTEGSGLGLSLVAAAAKLHGGSIALEDNAPGLRAVLSLPVTPEPRVSAGTPAPA